MGAQLARTLGEDKATSFGGPYRRRFGELYGNFHQMRVKLGIKPWERNFTPGRLMELIQFQGLEGDEDVQHYLNEYGPEKVSEALNTIASTEADTRRLERLNFTPDDNVIMRPSSTYS